MLDICSKCRAMNEKLKKPTLCEPCPDKPPKVGQIGEYLIAFSRKATLGRGGMSELDYRYVDDKINKETDDERIREVLLDFISKVESVKIGWKNRK